MKKTAVKRESRRKVLPDAAKGIARFRLPEVSKLLSRTGSAIPQPEPRKFKATPMTAAYRRGRDGWIVAEILEAESVYTQGRTMKEARENLIDVVGLMVEQAPHQFGVRHARKPRGAKTEKFFLIQPA